MIFGVCLPPTCVWPALLLRCRSPRSTYMLSLCYLYAMAELCVVVLQESRIFAETWTICSPDLHRDLSWTCSAEASGLHSWYGRLYIMTHMSTPVVFFGSAVMLRYTCLVSKHILPYQGKHVSAEIAAAFVNLFCYQL